MRLPHASIIEVASLSDVALLRMVTSLTEVASTEADSISMDT